MAVNSQQTSVQRIARIIAAERTEILDMHAAYLQVCLRILVLEVQTSFEIQINTTLIRQRSLQFDGISAVAGDILPVHAQHLNRILPVMLHGVVVIRDVMSGKGHTLGHPNQRFGSARFLHFYRRLNRVRRHAIGSLFLHFLLALHQPRQGRPAFVYLVIGCQTVDGQAIQDKGVVRHIAFADGDTQFIERSHLILTRVAQAQAGQGQVSSQQNIGNHIQTSVHMQRSVHLGAQARDIQIVLNKRQDDIGMHIMQVQLHRIAVGLQLHTGYDTYPAACRQTEFDTGVRLRIIEIQTRNTERQILQFPLFVAHYIAVADIAVIDSNILQTNRPFALRSVRRHRIVF